MKISDIVQSYYRPDFAEAFLTAPPGSGYLAWGTIVCSGASCCVERLYTNVTSSRISVLNFTENESNRIK